MSAAGEQQNLIISLNRCPAKILSVKRCTLVDRQTVTDFSIAADGPLQDVVRREIAAVLCDVVHRADKAGGRLELRDFRLEFRGLILAGCMVSILREDPGPDEIELRFARNNGRVRSLFVDSSIQSRTLLEDVPDKELGLVERVFDPLRGFSEQLEELLEMFPNLLDEAERGFLYKIKTQIDGLAQYTDLLTRYVASHGASGVQVEEDLIRLVEDPQPERYLLIDSETHDLDSGAAGEI